MGVAEGVEIGDAIGEGDDVAIGAGVAVIMGVGEVEELFLIRTPLLQASLPLDFTQV